MGPYIPQRFPLVLRSKSISRLLHRKSQNKDIKSLMGIKLLHYLTVKSLLLKVVEAMSSGRGSAFTLLGPSALKILGTCERFFCPLFKHGECQHHYISVESTGNSFLTSIDGTILANQENALSVVPLRCLLAIPWIPVLHQTITILVQRRNQVFDFRQLDGFNLQISAKSKNSSITWITKPMPAWAAVLAQNRLTR